MKVKYTCKEERILKRSDELVPIVNEKVMLQDAQYKIHSVQCKEGDSETVVNILEALGILATFLSSIILVLLFFGNKNKR